MIDSLRAMLGGQPDGADKARKLAQRDFSFAPAARTGRPRFNLAVTAIIRDEEAYLREWLEFHRMVGVEHFYIYDNESTDGTSAILESYRDKGLLTVYPWPSFTGWNGQYAAYAHSTKAHRQHSRWMMFIDIDEFAFPAEGHSLQAPLDAYGDFSRVKLPWRCFGHGGHNRRPAGLVTESYRYRFDPDQPINEVLRSRISKYKSIVDPCRVIRVHPHEPETDDDKHAIEEKAILLNHYVLRSEEEFAAKLARGYDYREREITKARSEKLAGLKEAIENSPIEDLKILRFLPALKGALGIPPVS